MNCAPNYGQFKKAHMQLVSGPDTVPGPFYLSLIDNGDDVSFPLEQEKNYHSVAYFFRISGLIMINLLLLISIN